MEKCWNEKKTMEEEPLLENTRKKGGLKAVIFIIGYDALQKMATFGLIANMTLYLMEQYHMEMATASNILFFWSAAINFMPFIGAIIADSYLGKFYTIGFGSLIYLLGMILLWSTTVIPQARPPPCDQNSSNICNPPTFLQTLVLCVSLGLISIGAGGIKSSSLAFGANQLENEDCHENSGVSESYVSWYYVANTFSVLISLTCLVYIQDNMGWKVGFAVPTVLVLLGTLLFFLGSPLYVKVQSKTSLLTGFVQVVVASYKNRRFKLPSDTTNLMYHYKNDPSPGLPSEKLKFLNKACTVRDPEKDLTPDGRATDPWSLCTAEQVEELKALMGVVPIWSTGVFMFVNLSQPSFPVLQAASMDRRITSGLTIPAASFCLFTVISVILWVTLYDRIFLPLASRAMSRPVHISTRRRMGFGIFLSFLALMVMAFVESIRLSRAKESETYPYHMSALWLVPQYCLNGLAEASNDIAQIEFYFSELPRSMSTVASNLDGVGVAVGNLLAGFVLNIVDSISKAGGRSWISSNINEGHYDYYYLVLTGLSVANMVYYLVCVRAYGPLKAEKTVQAENEDEL